MKTIKNSIGNETIIFAETFEQEAFDQVKKLANFEPYQKEKIRIMPDAHAGKGCTVGTTMTVTDKITPNLVGVDIGCGMLTIKLKDTFIDYSRLDKMIRTKIPHGFGVHDAPRRDFDFSSLRCGKFVDLARAHLSIGTLGGGNHFIEFGRSEKSGEIYLVIHSGSRKLGGDVCNYYQNKALEKMGEMHLKDHSEVDRSKIRKPKKENKKKTKGDGMPFLIKDLAFLSGNDFDDYMHDMSLVQKFASTNREMMAEIIIKEMDYSVIFQFETIHNYIDFNRMILRKGAVSAEKDELLLIPINMRDGSLVCRGKGNANWNYSAPHGAGRLMSRSKAKKVLQVEEFVKSMKGIYTTTAGANTLDEAPSAYKSMDEIVSSINDTAEIIDTIRPIYNFKA